MKTRMFSLDVFRGITITMMVLVNNPGHWDHMYTPLKHSQWNGWTLTDLIFPFFIFIMGVSIVFALSKKQEMHIERDQIYLDILKRTCKLFGLGLFLNLVSIHLLDPNYHWIQDTLFKVRWMGVLQRLAIVYAISSFLFLKMSPTSLMKLIVVTLTFYWLMMVYAPFSVIQNGRMVDLTGCLEHGKNFAAYLDNLILRANHVYYKDVLIPYDPEGIFSTLTATTTCLFGVLTGLYLQKSNVLSEKISILFFWGVLGVVTGQVMAYGFPINKTIWSPSYVVLTSGMALIFLAMCMVLIDEKGMKRWTKIFVVFGSNAIAFFMISAVFARVLLMFHVQQLRLWAWIYQSMFEPFFEAKFGSLVFSVVFLMILYVLMNWMYKNKIFWKV